MSFQPTQLSNLAAWFDAADPKAFDIVNGNQVSTWFDKSGNGRNATNPFNSPIWNTSNTVLFPGGVYLNVPDLATTLPGNTFNIFFVGKRTSGQENNYILAGSDTGSRQNLQFGYEATFFTLDLGSGVRTNGTVAAFNLDTEPRRLIGAAYTGAQRQVFLNGVTANTSADTTGLLGYADPRIGLIQIGNIQSTVTFIGEINELLFFTPVLSQSDRELVDGYLAWKWGLNTNLPLSNPYRFYPPGINTISNSPEVIEADSQFVPGIILLPSTTVLQNRIVTMKDIGGTFSSVTVQANTFTNTLQASTLNQNLNNPYDIQTYVASGQQWYTLEGSVQNALTTSSITANAIFTGSINYISSVLTNSIQMIDTVSNTLGNVLFPSSSFLRFGDEIISGTNQASGILSLNPQTIFQPNQVAGLAAWYDFSDTNTLTIEDNRVRTWFDKSGNNRDATQNTLANCPNYLANNGVFFDGNKILNVNNALNIATNIGYITGFFVYSLSDLTLANRTLYFISRSTDNTARSRWDGARNNTNVPSFTGRRVDSVAVATVNAKSSQLLVNENILYNAEVLYSNARINMFVNGTLTNPNETIFLAAGNTTNSNSTSVSMGNNPGTANQPLNGVIKEILIYTVNTLSASSRQQIEGYLSWKWGLVGNLDPSHPYKNVPPSA